MAVDHINHVAVCVCVCVAALDCSYQFSFILPSAPTFSRGIPIPTPTELSSLSASRSFCAMDCWEPNEGPPSPSASFFVTAQSVCEGGRENQRWQVGYIPLHLPLSPSLPPSFWVSHLLRPPRPSPSILTPSSPSLMSFLTCATLQSSHHPFA